MREKMDRLTNFGSNQQKEGFINFLEAVIEFFRGVWCYSCPVVQGSSSTVTLHTSNTKRCLPPPSSHMPHARAHTYSLHTGVVRRVGEEMFQRRKIKVKGNCGAGRRKIKEKTV